MSNISIPGCISDLLFERNSVVLPGIGLFETKLKESSVDQIQGMIHPPSKEISFNSNVTGDDGVLVDFIKKKNSAEEMAARTALAEFTNDLRLRIHRKEIVAIPDVGRLYLDFEKNLQFLPDRVNYNKDSFGLPSLNYYPVLQDDQTPPPVIPPNVKSQPAPKPDEKSEELKPQEAKSTISESPSVSTPDSKTAETVSRVQNISKPAIPTTPVKPEVPVTVIPNSPDGGFPNQNNVFVEFLAKAAPFILVFALIFVAYIFYKYLVVGANNNYAEQDVIERIDGRVNKSPTRTEDGAAKYEDEEIMDQTNEGMTYDDEYDEDFSDNTETVEEDPVEEREYIEPSRRVEPGGKNGVIIIGGFSSARNAQKQVEKVQRKGFSPYTDAKGKLTRVGVEFSFDTVADLDDMLRQVRREFNSSAWILEPKLD